MSVGIGGSQKVDLRSLVRARIEEATMSRKTMRVRLDQMHSTFDICVDAKADQSAQRAPQQD